MAIDNFIKQIVWNKNIRKLKIVVPQNHLPSFKKCLLALATNDYIDEISIDKMDLYRITQGNPNVYPMYEMSRLLSKKGLKTLNLDC